MNRGDLDYHALVMLKSDPQPAGCLKWNMEMASDLRAHQGGVERIPVRRVQVYWAVVCCWVLLKSTRTGRKWEAAEKSSLAIWCTNTRRDQSQGLKKAAHCFLYS